MEHLGNMQHAGPEEKLFSKANRDREGYQEKRRWETLIAWKNELLTESFEFRLLETFDARYMAAYQLRDSIVRDFKTVALHGDAKSIYNDGLQAS